MKIRNIILWIAVILQVYTIYILWVGINFVSLQGLDLALFTLIAMIGSVFIIDYLVYHQINK